MDWSHPACRSGIGHDGLVVSHVGAGPHLGIGGGLEDGGCGFRKEASSAKRHMRVGTKVIGFFGGKKKSNRVGGG